jgi:hypothetical protein
VRTLSLICLRLLRREHAGRVGRRDRERRPAAGPAAPVAQALPLDIRDGARPPGAAARSGRGRRRLPRAGYRRTSIRQVAWSARSIAALRLEAGGCAAGGSNNGRAYSALTAQLRFWGSVPVSVRKA